MPLWYFQTLLTKRYTCQCNTSYFKSLLKQYDFYDSKLIIILAYRKLLCEGEIGSIKCGKDQTIRIIRGSYGRSDSATCWTGTGDAGKCTGENALLTMYESCSGKQSCDLSASDSVFGNACSNASSYLDVEYFCEGMTGYIRCCVYYYSRQCNSVYLNKHIVLGCIASTPTVYIA